MPHLGLSADLRRYLHAAYIDFRLFLTGKREKGIPPLRLRDVGLGDFKTIGDGLVSLLIRNGLRPGDRVLDIGCGVGRVALPLTGYLSSSASYEGFDIVRRWVRWCRRNITPRHPHFRFTHADIFNSHYNRGGVPATRYRFPWPDGSFDFAFATSVFTHLDATGTAHYLAETGRVLRPGGLLLATFFLLDGTPAQLDFKVDRGDHFLLDSADPDWGVAFAESRLRELFPPELWSEVRVQRGLWRHGTQSDQFQDVVVAKKISERPPEPAPEPGL